MRCFSLLGLCLIGMCASLTGCVAAGHPFQEVTPPQNQAVIYVYRGSASYNGSAVGLDVDVDGQKIGTLIDDGYLYKVVDAGAHKVRCATEVESIVPFTAAPGKSYYITADVQMGFWVGRPKLTMVPEDTGKLAILSAKYCGSDK